MHPASFAIFSTPVINIVQVHQANAIDLYLAYCEELNSWKEHFKMQTVADTEMALWSFAQLTKKIDNSPKVEQSRKAFEGELWIQRRRAALVLRPIMKNNAPFELAKILLEENPKLAGKLAAEEYERLLRLASRKFYGHDLPLKRGAAESLIDRIASDNHISIPQKFDLYKIWELRNRVVHPEESPSATEVEWMVEHIEQICLPWGDNKLK